MEDKKTKIEAKRSIGWVLTSFVTIALIILFLPREKTFNYEFTMGKPWRYEQLTASWDFAIEKSDEVFQRERDEAAARVLPYYVLDPAVATAAADSLESRFSSQWSSIMPRRLHTAVSTRLEQVYRDGIFDSSDYSKLQADSINRVKVILGINSIERPVSTMRSVLEAYEYVMAADTTAYGTYILRSCNLNDYIRPNLRYEDDKTSRARTDAMEAVLRTKGLVQAGQKIIGAGDIVDDEAYQTLQSYRQAWIRHTDSAGAELTLIGGALIVVLLIVALIVYLFLYRRDILDSPNAYLFIAAQIVIFTVVSALLVSKVDVMIIPFTMAPLFIRVFIDSRTAFMTHLVIILITSLFVPEPYIFILLQLTAGLAVIYSLKELNDRGQLFRSVFIVLLTYCIVWFGYQLILVSDIRLIGRHMFVNFLTGALLLLFTYPLMYLYEKLFRFTSNVTLIELSNYNNKLLLELSEKAPGTFQHCIQVSNLAAAAARAIGAKVLLVRAGGLYHDIGKLGGPAFFTENQITPSPHDGLPYEESARIIINHVAHGLELADKYHLPESIKQFIRTHHGQSKAKYFYNSYANEHPGEEFDPAPFTYAGPKPTTKETALLMMADGVEAASRSLTVYTSETIGSLVSRIIDSQMADGAFAECPITFSDIAKVKQVFTEKIASIYHPRTSYPELRNK